jgi:hypothetical protein
MLGLSARFIMIGRIFSRLSRYVAASARRLHRQTETA